MTVTSLDVQDAGRVPVVERRVGGGLAFAAVMSQVESSCRSDSPLPPSLPQWEDGKAPQSKGSGDEGRWPETGQTSVATTEGEAAGVDSHGRRKLKNEDSSYDSDCDSCEPTSPRPSEHDDICRTVSDTLGAEYEEYITQKPSPGGLGMPSCDMASCALATYDTGGRAVSPPPDVHGRVLAQCIQNLQLSLSSVSNTVTTITTATPSTQSVSTARGVPVLTVSQPTPPPCVLPTSSKFQFTLSATSPVSTVTCASSSTATPVGGYSFHHVPKPQAVELSISTTSASSTGPASTYGTPSATPISPTSAQSSTAPTATTSAAPPSTTPAIVTPSNSSVGEAVTATPWVAGSAAYAQQVEFGVKLGYSEAMVQLALAKLGASPVKDEFLAELIRLGKGAPRPDSDAEAAEAEGESKDDSSVLPPLRPVIVDGSNVAMSHGNKTTFSCQGLRLCVDWFRARGHTQITVFVPTWRKEASRFDASITDQEILHELEREKILVFTPSRTCSGKRIVPYDDRYILKEAVDSNGVIVSNDNYRDLVNENPSYRRVVEESILMYSWVNGKFVPPDDPLGRNGPTLDSFLRRPTPGTTVGMRDLRPCPYGRKCTYGNKCKYMHPERGTAPVKSVTERLQEQAQKHFQDKAKSGDSSQVSGVCGKSLSLPVGVEEGKSSKKPITRAQTTAPAVSMAFPAPPVSQEMVSSVTGTSAPIATSDSAGATASGTTPLPPHHLSPVADLDPHVLYPMYTSQGPPASYGSSSWNWKNQGTDATQGPMCVPSGSHSPGQPGGYVPHLGVPKQLPDHDAASSDNPHRKLQRQLTLNPAYDSRLYKMVKVASSRETAQDVFSLLEPISQQQKQQIHLQHNPEAAAALHHMKSDADVLSVPGVCCLSGQCGSSFSGHFVRHEQAPSAPHQPLARHSSAQDGSKQLPPVMSHLYPSYSHPNVARYSSAPDPIRGGGRQQTPPGPPHMSRLNSTSDTYLNLHGCSSESTQNLSDPFDESLQRLQPFATHQALSHSPSAPSPGPVGSRPMSPQQQHQQTPPPQPPAATLHPSPVPSPRAPLHQHLHSSSSRSVPSVFSPSMSGNSKEDKRLHMFISLARQFPEAQVRAVLARYPDETDFQKICALLAPPHGLIGSRPVSPQQMTAAASSVGSLSPLPLHGSSSQSAGFTSSLTASTTHEDARFKAFWHLSNLFPVSQVQSLFARYPDETDPQKLCALLVAMSTSQS